MNNPSESGQFFDLLSSFSQSLVPIIAVIVLVLLGVLLWELIKFVKGLDTTVDKINSTIDTVESSVEKLQVPLNTVASISTTVDTVHEFTKRAVGKSISLITDNFAVVKEWTDTLFTKK